MNRKPDCEYDGADRRHESPEEIRGDVASFFDANEDVFASFHFARIGYTRQSLAPTPSASLPTIRPTTSTVSPAL